MYRHRNREWIQCQLRFKAYEPELRFELMLHDCDDNLTIFHCVPDILACSQFAAENRILHIDVSKAVRAIKQREKKRRIIRACRGQAVLLDRGDLLLQLREQLFLLE